MTLLQAHGLIALAAPEGGVSLEPAIGAALASLSGQLEDARDLPALREAIAHGLSLLSCGVLTEEDVLREADEAVRQVLVLGDREEPRPCLN
jgi:hypothetical protein